MGERAGSLQKLPHMIPPAIPVATTVPVSTIYSHSGYTTHQDTLNLYYDLSKYISSHCSPLKGNYILLHAFFIIQSIHFKPIGFAGFSISAKPMLKQEALCPRCHPGRGSDTDGPQPRQEDTDQQTLRCCCIRGLKYILWGQSGFDL